MNLTGKECQNAEDVVRLKTCEGQSFEESSPFGHHPQDLGPLLNYQTGDSVPQLPAADQQQEASVPEYSLDYLGAC
jgi:hypothetical protein